MGGVCQGLALHLGLPVVHVRVVVALLTLLGGAGAVVYVFLWLFVPVGDPARVAADARPATLTRLAPRLRDPARRVPLTDIGLGLLLLAGAGLLVAYRAGWRIEYSWVVPTLILLAGAGLAWSQLDRVEREHWLSRAGGRTPVSVLRLAGGMLLVGLGVVLLLGQDASADMLLRSATAAVAVLIGAALVLAPWWLRLVRELGDERAARARESERADIAAHLHDSVLQTLALIRARAGDADDVARLARAQERELRGWLYDDRSVPGTSVADEVRDVVGDVEDMTAVAVEVVVVGDCVPDRGTDALLKATREALLNAARHGAPPVTLYLEVTDDQVEVFVRDRGEGFDLDAVPEDRFGVRESIIGRMRRHGGTARLRVRPGEGTEVHLCMPRTEERGNGS